MISKQAFLNNVIEGSPMWSNKSIRQKLKASERSSYNKLISRFTPYQKHHVVGPLVDMLTALGEVTQEEWEDWYREWCNSNGNHGLLTEIAWRLWNDTGCNIHPARVFSFVVNRILDETYDGVQTERKAMGLIMNEWDNDTYNVRHATRWEERDYAIDFIVETSEGNIVKAYQVKPDTFFSKSITRERNPKLFSDRISNCIKMNNLALRLEDFEAVEFLRKSDLENGELVPLSISSFDRSGNVLI